MHASHQHLCGQSHEGSAGTQPSGRIPVLQVPRAVEWPADACPGSETWSASSGGVQRFASRDTAATAALWRPVLLRPCYTVSEAWRWRRPCSGHRVPLGEPGAGGGHLVEMVSAERLADLGHKFGLSLPQHRPRSQPRPAAQALGRPRHQRRPLGVARHQRPPGQRGQAQGHAAGAAGRQAQAQRLSSSARWPPRPCPRHQALRPRASTWHGRRRRSCRRDAAPGRDGQVTRAPAADGPLHEGGGARPQTRAGGGSQADAL